ncbi:MAG: OmpA family protein [Cyclobacteriaceae bacterium]|nr:OmpA family protein [Cyclobacteriaceae bacterium]
MKTMDKLDFREIANAKISSRIRQAVILMVAVILGMILSVGVNAQDRFHQKKERFYKAKLKTQKNIYANACNLLDKKRTQKPKSNSLSKKSNRESQKPMAEVDSPSSARNTEPKNEVIKSTVVAKQQTKTTPQTLEELHTQEDVVLAKNNLPAPSSKKHEEIRKQVADVLKSKKENEPIELAPLYFTFDQDEFAVVDMDPFLIAVEYALQGRTILIEGHTDSQGNESYNMQLSVKRVQKIRQLMNDMGVPDDRISVVGYGEEIALHDNKSEDGRQRNRRVDFKAF